MNRETADHYTVILHRIPVGISDHFRRFSGQYGSGPESLSQWRIITNGTMLAYCVRESSETGATGDPRKVNIELGLRRKELAVENLKKLIRLLKEKQL